MCILFLLLFFMFFGFFLVFLIPSTSSFQSLGPSSLTLSSLIHILPREIQLMKRKEARERTNPKTRDEKTRKNKKLTVSEYGLETHAASRGYRSVSVSSHLLIVIAFIFLFHSYFHSYFLLDETSLHCISAFICLLDAIFLLVLQLSSLVSFVFLFIIFIFIRITRNKKSKLLEMKLLRKIQETSQPIHQRTWLWTRRRSPSSVSVFIFIFLFGL